MSYVTTTKLKRFNVLYKNLFTGPNAIGGGLLPGGRLRSDVGASSPAATLYAPGTFSFNF